MFLWFVQDVFFIFCKTGDVWGEWRTPHPLFVVIQEDNYGSLPAMKLK